MNEKPLNAVFTKDQCIVPRDHLSGPAPRPVLVKAGTRVNASVERDHFYGQYVLAIYVPGQILDGVQCYQFGRLLEQRGKEAVQFDN